MEAKNNTEAENMFRAALSRYSQNYEKAIKNIEGHRKAGKDILFGERICRSAFIFMIWLFTAAIIQTETVLPVKKNTITIIVTVAAVIAWVALLNGKHCLEHCLFMTDWIIGSETYKTNTPTFRKWICLTGLYGLKMTPPTPKEYEQAVFDEMGELKKFYKFGPMQTSIEFHFSDYNSIDKNGKRVVECCGVSKDDWSFLKSMYGEDGPTCSDKVSVTYVTDEPIKSFMNHVPDDLRKNCIAVVLFNRWSFLIWDVDNPPELERNIDELTGKIACITASHVLNKMSEKDSIWVLESENGELLRTNSIRRKLFPEDILASFFRRPRHTEKTESGVGDILEKLEREVEGCNNIVLIDAGGQ